jgi:hypothetical protein
MRENVFNEYNAKVPSALHDAQRAELDAAMAAERNPRNGTA